MSVDLALERKYVNMVGVRLHGFIQKSDRLWNFKCPICGDSKANKRKQRGYIFYAENGYRFHCHNCECSFSFRYFLKQYYSDLFKSLQFEKYNRNPALSPPQELEVLPPEQPKEEILLDRLLPRISQLKEDHPAVKYLMNREIPKEKFELLYYIDDIYKIKQFKDKYQDRIKLGEGRIVIPYFSEKHKLLGVICRDITNNSPLKYLKVVVDSSMDFVYGMERVDKSKLIYVVEGQFDSFFLPNALAAGSSDLRKVAKHYYKANVVLVPDCQPRNPEIVRSIQKFIADGYRVCLMPEKYGKDINEMVLNGYQDQIMKIIQENTFAGLDLQLNFVKWKKV